MRMPEPGFAAHHRWLGRMDLRRTALLLDRIRFRGRAGVNDERAQCDIVGCTMIPARRGSDTLELAPDSTIPAPGIAQAVRGRIRGDRIATDQDHLSQRRGVGHRRPGPG